MITLNFVSKLRQVQPFLVFRRPTPPQVLPERPANFNPLQWLLDPDKGKSQVDRILAELVRAEAHEPDVWLKDDYRQAFVIVSLAAKGHPHPLNESSRICYGIYADQVWPAIVARRKADCGKLYPLLYDENDIRRPGPTEAELLAQTSPKKPVQSVTRDKKEEAA